VTPERRIEALRSAVATGLPQNAALACQKDMEHDRTGVVSAVDREAGLRSRLADAYVRSAPGGIRLAYLLTGDRAVAEDLVQEAFVRFVGRFRFLRYYEDLPDATIAELLGCRQATVRSLVARGLEALRTTPEVIS